MPESLGSARAPPENDGLLHDHGDLCRKLS